MIDWIASNIIEGTATNKSRMVVKCDGCGAYRTIAYLYAKRSLDHKCQACLKKKHGLAHKRGDLVEYTCIECSTKETYKFRPDRFVDWRCHHCAMKQGHRDGKFVIVHNKPSEAGRKKIGAQAKAQWADPEYRAKWSKSMSASKEKRSAKSKEIWSDQVRLKKLSAALRTVWSKPDYKAVKAKRSQELWEDEEYRERQLAGYTDEVRKVISEASLAYWRDHADEMIALITSIHADPEIRKKHSASAKAAWANPEYRAIQMAKVKRCKDNSELLAKMSEINREILSRPEVKARLSKSVRKAWEDTQLRLDQSAASKALWQDSAYKEVQAVARAAQSGRISSIQKQLYKYLGDLNINFYEESDKTRLGHYVFDCLIPKQNNMSKNLLIECHGDYWHSSLQSQSRDRGKFTYIDKYFKDYEIMYIWEHEFGAANRVIDRLKLKVGVALESVDFEFSDVKFEEASGGSVKSFLDAYHYIGKDRGGRVFTAKLNDELIGCVVYSPPLRQNTASQFGLKDGEVRELSRLCIHPSYHKKNFASWIIAKSLRALNNSVKLIIAYADATIGHVGTVYKASGFKLDHMVDSDYWYIDSDSYVMHKRTLYGKAVKMKMSEAEFANKNGYVRVYGGRKYCYVKHL